MLWLGTADWKSQSALLINLFFFRFNISGNKNYFSHKFVYECYFGVVKNGLVVDHLDGCPQHNELNNLEAITQSEF